MWHSHPGYAIVTAGIPNPQVISLKRIHFINTSKYRKIHTRIQVVNASKVYKKTYMPSVFSIRGSMSKSNTQLLQSEVFCFSFEKFSFKDEGQMKKLIQLTLATVFVVITVLTVNINKADAAPPCMLQNQQAGCQGFATQGTPISFAVEDQAPFQAGATVEVRGACDDFRIHVPPHGFSQMICFPKVDAPYLVINDGPDSVRVAAISQ